MSVAVPCIVSRAVNPLRRRKFAGLVRGGAGEARKTPPRVSKRKQQKARVARPKAHRPRQERKSYSKTKEYSTVTTALMLLWIALVSLEP